MSNIDKLVNTGCLNFPMFVTETSVTSNLNNEILYVYDENTIANFHRYVCIACSYWHTVPAIKV